MCMKTVRRFAGRQFGRLSAAVDQAVGRVRWMITRCTPVLMWIEDRAEVLFWVFMGLTGFTFAVLVLFAWAQVVRFALQVMAVVTLVMFIAGAATGALHWLQKKRDKRTRPPEDHGENSGMTDGFSPSSDGAGVDQPNEDSMTPPPGAHG